MSNNQTTQNDTQNNQKNGEIITDTSSSNIPGEGTITTGDHITDVIDGGLKDDTTTKNELISQLQDSNRSMQQELDKITTIAATSQSQYITLKSEFDSYIRRIDSEKREIKVGELKKIVGKFSKLLEQIRLLLSHLTAHGGDNDDIKGLQLIYDSFIGQELAQLGVFQIQSLGLLPDSELHEVLMVQQATDDDLKNLQEYSIKLNNNQEDYTLDQLTGHCIQELEVGYYYLEGEKRMVIKPSKVVVAQ